MNNNSFNIPEYALVFVISNPADAIFVEFPDKGVKVTPVAFITNKAVSVAPAVQNIWLERCKISPLVTGITTDT